MEHWKRDNSIENFYYKNVRKGHLIFSAHLIAYKGTRYQLSVWFPSRFIGDHCRALWVTLPIGNGKTVANRILREAGFS